MKNKKLEESWFREIKKGKKGANIKKLEYILALKCDVNAVDGRTGETALMIMAKAGNIEMVDYLLKKGANVNFKFVGRGGVNLQGDSALIYAVRYGHIEVAKKLIENGGNVNDKNLAGQSVLGVACYNNREDMVDLLISNGADVNYYNRVVGRNILMIACEKASYGVVEKIINAKAKLNKTNDFGLSALWFAVSRENKDADADKENREIIYLLAKSGIDIKGDKYYDIYSKWLKKLLAKGNREYLKSIGKDVSVIGKIKKMFER
ncbi:MAG: ankyrin repeat domain-containing protein [Alphaproteobacteria bacterium]|nr:ankyrin repeat domain-containing protein [Alphaproteobacteria bacterium]